MSEQGNTARGTHEWFESLRTTGRWDRPRFWKNPDYQEMSPCTPAEHREAFAALRSVYPPQVVKRLFSSSQPSLPWISHVLMDPFRPDLSGLLALGFDAAHLRVERFESLVRGLRDTEGYRGARLELTILAALERAEIKYVHEPYAHASKRRGKVGQSHPNPDLRVRLGEWVTADIKDLVHSARASRVQDRFMRATRGPDPHRWEWIPATVEALPRWTRLERIVESEARIERLADKIHHAALLRVQHMRALGFRESLLAGLVKLTITPAGFSNGYTGHPLDDHRDAERVLSRLDEAASQIPTSDTGVVFVEPSESESLPLVADAVQRWLSGPSRHVVGVVVLADAYHEGAPHSTKVPRPIWRAGAPPKLRRAAHWSRFYAGLNWRWMRAMKIWVNR